MNYIIILISIIIIVVIILLGNMIKIYLDSKKIILPEKDTEDFINFKEKISNVLSNCNDYKLTDYLTDEVLEAISLAEDSEQFTIQNIKKFPPTTLGKVFKDTNSERGKYLFFTGRLISIERDGYSNIYDCLIYNHLGVLNTVHAYSVGDGNNYVAGDVVTCHGLVIGKFQYKTIENITENTANIIAILE